MARRGTAASLLFVEDPAFLDVDPSRVTSLEVLPGQRLA
jgi:hypothetical protein